MRTIAILLFAAQAASLHAQTAPVAQDPPDPRVYPKVERLHLEDNGTKIDEIRVGGQVQSVTVQPKGDLPAYELQPSDMARSRPADSREGFSRGTPRVWNVFNF